MIITARRGGGIAGTRLKQRLGPIDTNTLEPDAKQRLETAFAASGFFDLPAQLPRGEHDVSDAMWHSLEVDDGSRCHTVSWDDNSEVPESFGALVVAVSDAGTWEDDPNGSGDQPSYEVVTLEAVHDWMPGSPPTLWVRGTLRFQTLGNSVTVHRHEPQGINPLDLLLDVVVTPPSGVAGDQVDEVDFEFREDTDVRYETVTLLPSGKSVQVQDVS